jgi:hypothetical protein
MVNLPSPDCGSRWVPWWRPAAGSRGVRGNRIERQGWGKKKEPGHRHSEEVDCMHIYILERSRTHERGSKIFGNGIGESRSERGGRPRFYSPEVSPRGRQDFIRGGWRSGRERERGLRAPFDRVKRDFCALPCESVARLGKKTRGPWVPHTSE